MNLSKKKALAARTLNVGKARILFNVQRLGEIKEAITKQDIRDLHKEGRNLYVLDADGEDIRKVEIKEEEPEVKQEK